MHGFSADGFWYVPVASQLDSTLDYRCAVSGSVTDLIHVRFMFGLPEAAIVSILYDTLKAIDYLHSRDMIHR